MATQSLTLEQLLERLRAIKELGFVQTHRAHDTGVGKTLEDLLDVQENNLRLPDFGTIELKAKRLESQSMLTLVTKSPLPRGVNRQLFENYKYRDEYGEYALHCTVYGSRKNAQGLKAVFIDDKIVIENRNNILVYWPLTVFEILKAKSENILLVFAETYGKIRSETEGFHYVEAYVLSKLDQEKFQAAIQDDKLKIDIRIGQYRSGKFKGGYHDHGTAFRIMKKDFLDLFENYRSVI